MSEPFKFSLTEAEKAYLKDLVRLSIGSRLRAGGPVQPPDPPTDRLREHFGAFVTLKTRGRLRGCIGFIQGADELYKTVWNMAQCAAFEDPRFPPLSATEFADLEIEISILSPIEPCPDPECVEIGRHGLIVQRGLQRGLLLPQVPVECRWDRRQFLDQTCLKAGLPKGVWRDPRTELLWFEAEVF